MSTITWLVSAALAALIVSVVLIFNRLVALKNRIANAFAQIDVQLKRRHDLIPNLVEIARKYLAHEASTLEAVMAARGQATSAAAVARAAPIDPSAIAALAAAEQGLTGSLGRLLAVSEAYPDLKADTTMRSLSEELTSSENRLSFARQAYNDAVLDYNNGIGVFPALIVARLFSFGPAAMLRSTGNEVERTAPKVSF